MPTQPQPLVFSAHNIRLSDGTTTLPRDATVLAEREAVRALRRTLTAFFGHADPSTLRVVDLGCLEGGYTVELARWGYQALGIDARRTNIDRCEFVRRDAGLANLEFVVDDVKNLADHGQFDITFCSGLLYHLDRPREFLRLLGQVTTRLLILHTHFALEHDPFYDEPGSVAPDSKVDFHLSALTTHEGLPGRWYPEYSEDSTPEQIEASVWASFSNAASFWPTKPALLQAVREAGFGVVYEQYDFVDDIATDDYVRRNDRSMFVAAKELSG